MKKEIYLFDFDGTLVDSMGVYGSMMVNILDSYGVQYGDDIVKIITPLGFEGTARYYRDTLGLDVEMEELLRIMRERSLDEYRYNIGEKEGVGDTLRALRSRGARLNVLTASPHLTLDPCLRRLGLWELFDNVWSCDDFSTTKADPNIYRLAAERIGAPVGDIIFIDDNVNAVREAGMISYGIYDDSSADGVEAMKMASDKYLYKLGELI